jgi:diguanylate cyclase (GGDEF)-like protein/PAS domain S-box-containing protein
VLTLPVNGADGHGLGVLAVADTVARDRLPPASEPLLGQLARLAARLLERHQLQRRNRIAAQIMQADFSAVVVIDASGGVVFVNHAAETLFGGRARGMRGMPVEMLFPPHLQADPDLAHAWLHGRAQDTVERMNLHIQTSGQLHTVEAARCAWQLTRGEGVALVLRDITEHLRQRDQLLRVALYDPLTGLPNRTALLDMLAAELSAGSDVGLALVGLDNFKAVNDTLGHGTGDAVLQATAERLQAALPEDAMLARFGGDEFAVLCPGADAAELDTRLAGVLLQISEPGEFDGHAVHLDASIGIAIAQADEACGPSELIARADLALYKAKAAGGRRCCWFDAGMRQEINHRRMLDLELRRAHAQGEFEVHYQPQIDLDTGRTFGAEALLRWRHPERGLLLPVDFIDALAASPVAADVGRWIIRQACHDATRWPRIDGEQLAISINLFPVQVNNGQLQREVDQALEDSGLPAERLELEITEIIALNPGDAAAQSLAGLRKRGVRLSFDDFGTGYASLSLLQRLPVDRVKIDRSFVRDMLANLSDAAIIKSILLISSNLELQVTAEGVENHAQADLLRGLGCHGAQGFLYAPALAADAFGDWLEARVASDAAKPTGAGRE